MNFCLVLSICAAINAVAASDISNSAVPTPSPTPTPTPSPTPSPVSLTSAVVTTTTCENHLECSHDQLCVNINTDKEGQSYCTSCHGITVDEPWYIGEWGDGHGIVQINDFSKLCKHSEWETPTKKIESYVGIITSFDWCKTSNDCSQTEICGEYNIGLSICTSCIGWGDKRDGSFSHFDKRVSGDSFMDFCKSKSEIKTTSRWWRPSCFSSHTRFQVMCYIIGVFFFVLAVSTLITKVCDKIREKISGNKTRENQTDGTGQSERTPDAPEPSNPDNLV